MQTDNAIRLAGMKILSEKLGIVDAERFISLISRENFDYTKWREKNLNQNISVRELASKPVNMQKILNPEIFAKKFSSRSSGGFFLWKNIFVRRRKFLKSFAKNYFFYSTRRIFEKFC